MLFVGSEVWLIRILCSVSGVFNELPTLLQLPAPECAKGGSAAAPGHARVLRDGRRGVRGLPLPD